MWESTGPKRWYKMFESTNNMQNDSSMYLRRRWIGLITTPVVSTVQCTILVRPDVGDRIAIALHPLWNHKWLNLLHSKSFHFNSEDPSQWVAVASISTYILLLYILYQTTALFCASKINSWKCSSSALTRCDYSENVITFKYSYFLMRKRHEILNRISMDMNVGSKGFRWRKLFCCWA